MSYIYHKIKPVLIHLSKYNIYASSFESGADLLQMENFNKWYMLLLFCRHVPQLPCTSTAHHHIFVILCINNVHVVQYSGYTQMMFTSKQWMLLNSTSIFWIVFKSSFFSGVMRRMTVLDMEPELEFVHNS